MFIAAGDLSDTPTEGTFNHYGLSSTATVPSFEESGGGAPSRNFPLRSLLSGIRAMKTRIIPGIQVRLAMWRGNA
ncbi:Uncharacterised protein [Raoultella terrigena]|uniref:Uncharacterized protein n=1 Tax=Raoultella terrigena TaxID=577 RepID=A0A4U9DE30_RAOTE|nr:Uncharacterised protein [Raoultella terrigena]